MRKVGIFIGIFLFLLLIILILFWRFIPGEKIIGIFGDDTAISSALCLYPVKVTGNSMEPYFMEGERKLFSKCFSQEDITIGRVVAFKDKAVIRLGVIDQIKEELPGKIIYSVTQPNRIGRIIETDFASLIAVFNGNEVDIDEENESQTINLSDSHFSLPIGWEVKEQSDSQGVFNYNEEEAVNGFRTYLSVSSDCNQESLSDDYFTELKNEISSLVPGITFSNQNKLNINGQPSFAVEGLLRQNNLNFKVLTVAIEGQDNRIWIFNFNTLADNWENNAPIFEEIVNSFYLD